MCILSPLFHSILYKFGHLQVWKDPIFESIHLEPRCKTSCKLVIEPICLEFVQYLNDEKFVEEKEENSKQIEGLSSLSSKDVRI